MVFIKQVKITKLVNVYKSCSVVHLEGVLVREVILWFYYSCCVCCCCFVAVLFTAAKICSKTWRNCIYNKGFCFMRTLTCWNWHLLGKLTSITWLASTMILMSLWAILQSSRVTKVSEVPFLLQEVKNSRTKCKFVSVFNRMIETCYP